MIKIRFFWAIRMSRKFFTSSGEDQTNSSLCWTLSPPETSPQTLLKSPWVPEIRDVLPVQAGVEPAADGGGPGRLPGPGGRPGPGRLHAPGHGRVHRGAGAPGGRGRPGGAAAEVAQGDGGRAAHQGGGAEEGQAEGRGAKPEASRPHGRERGAEDAHAQDAQQQRNSVGS